MTLSRDQEEKIRAAIGVLVDTTPVGVGFTDLNEVTLKPRKRRLRGRFAFGAAFVLVLFLGVVSILFFDPEGDTGNGLDPLAHPLMSDAVPVDAQDIPTEELREVIALAPDDELYWIPVDGYKVLALINKGDPPHLYATSCDVLARVELPVGWKGTCLERTVDGQRVTGVFEYGEISNIWRGIWSKPDTTFESDELLPQLFVSGDEVLIIHGSQGGTTVEGEIYDSDTGEATRIASSGLVGRANAAMVWTGDELLIVGGANGPGIDQIGAAYSPVTDSWRPLPDPPGVVDAWENAITGSAVWTGSEMIIHSEGISFDPATGGWRTIASLPGQPRRTEIAVWTGDELVVWGGCDATVPQCDDFATGLLTNGYTYRPNSDEWQPMAASPLSAGVDPQGVWTGQEILVYAGAVNGDNPVTAAAYDPAADTWRIMPDPPLSRRRYAAPAWTGRYFVLWGGSVGEVEYGDGAAFDVVTDTWLRMPEAPGSDGRGPTRHGLGPRPALHHRRIHNHWSPRLQTRLVRPRITLSPHLEEQAHRVFASAHRKFAQRVDQQTRHMQNSNLNQTTPRQVEAGNGFHVTEFRLFRTHMQQSCRCLHVDRGQGHEH